MSWTDVTSAICDKVEATIGASTRRYVPIPEAIDLDQGGALYLRRGYAVDIRDASPIRRGTCSEVIAERLYLITLTREVNRTATNTDSRKSLKVEMLEDAELLRVAMCADQSLGGTASGIIWTADSGVSEFLEADRDKYYIIGINYAVTLKLT